MTVNHLAAVVRGLVEGDGSVMIGGVASIGDAEQGDIVFAENARFLAEAVGSRASAVVAFLDAVSPDKPLIKVENPRFAFAQILDLFAPKLTPKPGISASAEVGEGAVVAPSASIGPCVRIGDRTVIGERTIVLGNSYIGEDCVIGDDCVLYPNVSIYAHSVLGCRVILHAGVVIGSDGFGFVRLGATLHKVPHIGNVVVHDDVEIGANTTVDRGKTGSTIIGPRTKIDNLVHVAHNVRIGADSVIAAMVGIAGSAVIGDSVTIAGQVGVKDHVVVGDGAVLLAKAGIWGDIPERSVVSGSHAVPHRERLRQEVAIARGPETMKTVERLEHANAELTKRVEALEAALRQLDVKEDASSDELDLAADVAAS